MNPICTSQKCVNSLVKKYFVHILNIYMFVQHFLFYSHLSDCRQNILNIWNGIIKSIILLLLIKQVFKSSYRHLQLFIADQTSTSGFEQIKFLTEQTSTSCFKQSTIQNRASLPIAFDDGLLISPIQYYSRNTMQVRKCMLTEHGGQLCMVWTCRQNRSGKRFLSADQDM